MEVGRGGVLRHYIDRTDKKKEKENLPISNCLWLERLIKLSYNISSLSSLSNRIKTYSSNI